MTKQDIPNAGGWLNKAIKEEWTKSQTLHSAINQTRTKNSQGYVDKPQKEQGKSDSTQKIKQYLSIKMNDNNLPPTNLDAEEAILGGILLDPKAIDYLLLISCL